MHRLHVWPATLPDDLEGLWDLVAERSGVAATPLTSLDDLPAADGDRGGLVVVPDAAIVAGVASPGEVLDELQLLAVRDDVDLVAIVGDGYLSTDAEDLAATVTAGGVVSFVRSLATRQGVARCANVVGVPDAMFGRAATQRGPLRLTVETVDVAEAVAFLLGTDAAYVSGQVLFVDAGRQLFSSMSS